MKPNENLLTNLRAGHPRLIATAQTWPRLKTQRQNDALLNAYLKRVEAEARLILPAAPIAYHKDGKRLLAVSRTVLRRVLLLSLTYHLTDDSVFAQRAQAEMQNAASFADWNPSHFLDTAEMTAALALGYDWLYDALEVGARDSIATAIIDKGLKLGAKDNGWQHSDNNWNQVCLCGMSLGALALAEREPELAAQVLAKTKEFNINGLKPYAPDGVYPEGAMYWGYGTTFQTVLLGALQTALGTDWNLSAAPGFLQTAQALHQQLGPTGSYFNFSDNLEHIGIEPAVWWFARNLKQPALFATEAKELAVYAASAKISAANSQSERLLPLAAVWWPDAPNAQAQTPPMPLNWIGDGPTPLAIFRSDWNDANAMYFAIKGGKATNSHGHMDAASFVFEANGVRWGRDLGMQDYLSLESKNIDLWNSKQDSQRWQVFRLGPFSHSALTIDGRLHNANGNANITHFSASKDIGAIIDASPVFAGQATKVQRGVLFRPDSHLLIRDELDGLKADSTVRWAMPTKAQIELHGSEATLSENGQQLRAILHAPDGAKWETVSIEKPPHDYDAPNVGYSLLIANFTAPDNGHLAATVILQPLAPNKATPLPNDALIETALKDWPLPLHR